MKDLKLRPAGFTIVELVVVIVVIGILAGLSTMAYRSYIHQTEYSRISADMQKINAAIEKYYAKNGSYPLPSTGSGTWARRAAHGPNFIVGMVPEYLPTMPDIESGDKSDTGSNTFLYLSNGRNYKLIRLAAAGQSIPDHEIELVPSELRDTEVRWGGTSSPPYRGWGYWTSDAVAW